MRSLFKKLYVICLFVLLMGCSTGTNEPKHELHIPLNKIEKAVLGCEEGCGYYFELTDEDIETFVTAFNEIETLEYSEYLNEQKWYGLIPRTITFYTKEEEITISYCMWDFVIYNDVFYDVDMKESFFDVTRELNLKYPGNGDSGFTDWWDGSNAYNENESDYYAFGSIKAPNAIVSVNHTINEILEEMEYEERVENDQTILEVLSNYSKEMNLYETISFDNFDLKIIEMREGKVTAVIFTYKENIE